MNVRRLKRIVAGVALGLGLPALAEQGSAAMVLVEPPRTSAIEPENDGLLADLIARTMTGSNFPGPRELDAMKPALEVERKDAIESIPARTELLVMPDGMIHVRVRELWRISSMFDRGKLVAVPVSAGAKACVWWLECYQGSMSYCGEFRPVWRRLEGISDSESRSPVLISVIDHSRQDVVVGSVVMSIPPLAEVLVAQLSTPADPATVKREVQLSHRTKGVRLTLPWPDRAIDAWLTVSGPDGKQIMQGVASRGGTDREEWFMSEQRCGDPVWGTIWLPEGVDPESVLVEVRWIENSGPAAAKPQAAQGDGDPDKQR